MNFLLASYFWQHIWQWLDKWDTYLFIKINNFWTNDFLDAVFPWWREANTWTPLYLFLIAFALLNFGRKGGWWILFAVLTLVMTDQISSHLIKNLFMRPRPCADDMLMGHVRLLLKNCSGGYSFTSSHAANHFGFAVFVYVSFSNVIGKWKYAILGWAASIAYAQVYVGVHYPLDIIGGAILGCFIGLLSAKVFQHIFGEFASPLVL